MIDKMPNSSHQMILTDTHEGTEEWYCPKCGRTILIEWNPWKRTTVIEGDTYISHTGGKGGLVMGNIETNQ